MAGLAKARGRQLAGLFCHAVVTVGVVSVVHAQASVGTPEELLGRWRGTSLCTDRVAAPACQDETVVYEFTAGTEPGSVHWVAEKVVDGQRQRMGELELAYDKGEACWKGEFSSLRVRVVWCLSVNGARLSGGGRFLPGNQAVRKIDLRKD